MLAFHTLSKRSSMPGYRSGFVAGDPDLVAALKRYRPNTGTAPQTFVQRASVAAWSDEEHVVEIRERYARQARRPAARAARRRGLEPAGGDATFFLWMARARRRRRRVRRAARAGHRRRAGLVARPGGEGHVRVALVPTVRVRRAAAARCSAVGVQHLVEAAPRARALEGLDGAGLLLRRKSMFDAPLSSSALTTSPPGSVTRVPAVM